MEQDSPPIGSRQVLNAHVGMTNVIEQSDIDSVMLKTFSTIKTTLEDHCGPYGKYAMLVDPTNPTAQPAFTKDGINIIRAMEFVSPIERYVKNTVAYVGSRVERAAGDGTTSSVIIMTSVLEYLRKYLIENKISYLEFVDAYKEFEERTLSLLEKRAVRVDSSSTKELIYAIVYNQACTSSHGDKELSAMVAELYSTIPQPAWDYITYMRRGHESKERLVLEKEQVDFVSRARIYENTMFNTAHGDGFTIKDAELYVSSDQLVNNGAAYHNIKKLLTEVIADASRRIVICVPAGMDVTTRNEITTLLYPTHTQGRIAIFSLDADNPRINDLTCLMSICGEHYPYEPNDGILKRIHVDVEFKDFTLKLKGLIVRSTDCVSKNGAVNPNALVEGSPVYKQLRLLEEIIAAIMSATGHQTNPSKELKEYKRMYNNLLMSTKYTLIIGGSAYDNEAMVDVVEDALKASREALRSGIVLGGYATLKQELFSWLDRVVTDDDPVNNLANAFYHGIDELQSYVFKHCPKNMPVITTNEIVYHTTEAIHAMLKPGGVVYDVNTGALSTLENITSLDNSVIVQPLAVDKALIQRFGEVALKFLFTNRIVIPGGVVVNTQA